MSELAHKTAARSAAEEALLDAAERLLVDVGYARLARVNAEWRAVLTEALEAPHRELGIEPPLDAPVSLVSLVMTFNLGIIVERLGGIQTGYGELLDWIDQWLPS